ncbi:MAG TPA: hypothetical protein VM571_04110 [Noviherbaspirillum sp.]|nr:hypothetical protein [Noviherbaspirillum sp.]
MEKIEIPWNAHKRMLIVVAVFLPFIFCAFLTNGVSAFVFYGAVLFPAMLIYGWSLWFSPMTTEIDLSAKTVVHRYRPVFGKGRIKSYPLNQFRYVRSYLTIGRFPVNVVELVTNSGGEALCLTKLDPTTNAKSFFSVPREIEAERAKEVRESVASTCGLVDQGFLGCRMTGYQMH